MSELNDIQARAMACARLVLEMVSAEELGQLLNEYGRMDALMPIMDPTGYRQIMHNIPSHRAVVQALLMARRTIEREIDEEEGEEPTNG